MENFKIFPLVIKIYKTTKNGRPCTPIYVTWHYMGNVYLRNSRKTFKNKLFSYTGSCLHILGFRFIRHIGVK